jgi:hypothetical protein
LGGPFQIVSDVYGEELFTISTVAPVALNVDEGVLCLLSPEVPDQLFHFVDFEVELIFLAPFRQGPHLLPVSLSRRCW